MRISDWSSDVCSSDLDRRAAVDQHPHRLAVDLCLGIEMRIPGAVEAHIARCAGGGRRRRPAALLPRPSGPVAVRIGGGGNQSEARRGGDEVGETWSSWWASCAEKKQ